MTQPPQYPGQPEYQGQPGDPYAAPGQPPQAPPGQGWPPAPGVQDPFAAPPPTSAPPTSAPPTSGQPYAVPGQPPFPQAGYPQQDPTQFGQQPQFGQPDPAQYPQQPQYPATGAFPTGPQPAGQFPTGPLQQQPTSGFPAQPTSGFPGQPTSGFPGQPTSGFPADPYAGGYQPGYQQPAPPRKRGLMITLIVLAVVLVLCGGGGAAAYFVQKGNQGKGQPTAVDAVNGFLKAVYKDKNTTDALKYVCSSSRDKNKLAARVDDIKKYDAGLTSPTYTWPAPTVEKQDASSATLIVPIKVATSDEKVAETKYKFLATKDNGWWVCEITAA
ncbi:hypothetical protein [Dactylosporangium sp. NPDC000521]|uniref:Rv0361 family membrane protein n=1 Tax=Dactylosporangium sp. NPDC000521 TaxID=3363975 RepID=UPI0036A83AFB